MPQLIDQRSLAPDALPQRGVLYASLGLAIVLQYLYLLTFNDFPALRTPLSGALAVMHLALAASVMLLRPAAWNIALLAAMALFLVSLVPPHFLGLGTVHHFDVVEALRTLILPLILIWILAAPLALPKNLLWWGAVIGTLACAVVAFTGPTVYMGYANTDPRLAAFTGGAEHIHPSAKFVAVQVVLIDLLRRGGMMHPRLAWSLLAISVVLLLGYGGRNQIVFVAVYFLMLLFYRWRGVAVVKWSPPLLLILFATISVVALQVGSDVNDWGSGRIGVWAYRLDLIQQREVVPLFFGTGLGTDIMWTPQWDFDDEGLSAHNDYLHYLIENGLLGLAAIGLMMAGLWQRCLEDGRAIIVAVLANSMFSNGYLQSPLLATSLALALALSINVSLQRRGVLSSEDADAAESATLEGGSERDGLVAGTTTG